MNPLQQLRRLSEQRTKRNFIIPPEQIHPGVTRGMPPSAPERPALPLGAANKGGWRLEDLVPGEVVETEVGACYMSTTVYRADVPRGSLPLGALLDADPSSLASFIPQSDFHSAAAGNPFAAAAVIDTETTGLGGSAGTYPFMVGVGTFEANTQAPQTDGSSENAMHFVVRQLFMRTPADEPALLVVLHQLLGERTLLMSFNGRSFDVPLLRTRYALNHSYLPENSRLPALLQGNAPHLDLLHPARRLWSRRLQSCRLGNLETQVLGLERTEEDVPGSLIPHMYVAFLRTGHAGEMRRVFYHNAEDIVSTAAIAGQVCSILQRSPATDELDGRDWISLGASLETMKRTEDAIAAYQQAIARLEDPAQQRDAFRLLSTLCKRAGRWNDAVAAWEQWLATVPGADATPYIELAKYYEWAERDLEQARMWAAFGLHTVKALPAWQRLPGQLSDLERRLERLQRKQSTRPPAGTE